MELLCYLNSIKGLNAEIRKWKEHKGKANYLRLVHKACLKFTAKPKKISERFDFVILERGYANQNEQEQMQKAIILWMILDKDSIFYRKLEEHIGVSLRKEGIYFDNELFRTAVGKYLELLEPVILNNFDMKEHQTYVHTVYMYMLLPVELVRKWLWFCNVDFVGKEAFLRRLTSEQLTSLRTHWDLYVNQKIPMENLPCFTEGAANKVWKFFDLPYSFAPRMQEKHALAYNFCGLDIGFGLYPEKDNDFVASKHQAMQFISTAKRGECEVNMESGPYWYLYKTARSNEFYGKNKTVTLGPSICPGVWSTMFYWFYWLIVSPIFFLWLAGGVLLGYTELPLVVLFCGTLSLPSAILFLKARKFSEQKYDKQYVELLFENMKQMGGLFIAMVVLFAIAYVSVLALMLFVLSVLLLGTYCEKYETSKFWKMPLVGKLLPGLFLLTLAWEPLVQLWDSITLEATLNILGYSFATVFLFVAKWIFKFGIFLYDSKEVIGYTVIVLGVVSLLIAFMYHLFKWSIKKFDQLVEMGDQEVHSLLWLMKSVSFSIAVMVLGFTTGFFQNGTVDLGFTSSMIHQDGKMSALNLTLLVFFWVTGGSLVAYSTIVSTQFSIERAMGKRVVRKINKTIDGYGEDWERYMLDLSSLNRFFVSDVRMYRIRAIKAKQVLAKVATVDNLTKILVLKALRHISDDKGFENIKAFLDLGYPLPKMHIYESKEWEEMAGLLLAGKLNRETLHAIIDAPKALAYNAPERQGFLLHETALFKFIERIIVKIKAFFKWFYRDILVKGVSDLWHFLSGLNKLCPKSPSSNRARI